MIEPAKLDLRDGQPYSSRFRDIYHSPDGSAEVQRVFLQPAGFDTLLAERSRLTVAELGFGTGLNFAVCARRCLAVGARLTFISVEAHPIGHDDFLQLARTRRTDEPIYAELAHVYPPLIGGWHRRRLAGGRLTLYLFWGGAMEGVEQLAASQTRPVDVWLLDGFAPDRNPAMWTPELLGALAGTAREGTAVTTFTAAGRVRRALTDAGFQMRRVDQRPHKRESLAGRYEAPGRPRPPGPGTVSVVGAGIAGAAAARTLAESGWAVRVYEAAPRVAAGASSIPATLVHPRLGQADGAPADLRASAYTQALAAVAPFAGERDTGVQRSGALQLPSANFPEARLEATAERHRRTGLGVVLVSAAEASELAGISLDSPALYFADACLVDAPRLCATLLDHPGIELLLERPLADWPEGPTLLACGAAAQAFPGAEYLELTGVHGQLDRLRGEGPLSELRLPLIGGGYVAPLGGRGSELAVGASYEHRAWSESRASAANLAHLVRLTGSDTARLLGRHRAARTITSDRQPVLGPLRSAGGEPQAERLVSTGHGSMGMVTSHLGAALVDAHLQGEVLPLAPPLAALVDAGRFHARQARRGYRLGARAPD